MLLDEVVAGERDAGGGRSGVGADGRSGAPGMDGFDGLDGQPGSPGRGIPGMCARAIGFPVVARGATLRSASHEVISSLLPRDD